MKIALVHDYLREYGGAERVVEALHEIWPEAPLYTSFVDWKSLGDHATRFKNWDIKTSWVQHNWIVKKLHSPLRFLAPKIWESFDVSEYDVVISSSGWYISRGIKAGNGLGCFSEKTINRLNVPDFPAQLGPLHICYIHHPPRNLYGYATGSDVQKYAVVRAYSSVVNFFLRHYDFETAQKVDYFIANSKETARRVRKFYRRESTVIYPPVEINDKFQMTNLQINSKSNTQKNVSKDYFLSVGRLSWAKRVDLAIEACNELKLPLKIAGTGKELSYLKSIAGPTINFVGSSTDDELIQHYQGAKALIFTALEEDFGMVPVEAMGQGTPVIALAQGGVLETVIDKKTGIHFHKPTKESLVTALREFNTINGDWSKACRAQAQNFTKAIFHQKIRTFVEKNYKSYLSTRRSTSSKKAAKTL